MQNLLELCRRLEQRIAILEAEIEILRAENKALKIENAELKEKLGLNSKNSSLPSSRDLYKLKKEKPKSDRNIGGQPGHQGITRQKMEADEIIKVNLLELTCACGGAISILANPYIHQKTDIPEIKPIVTEYHLQHGRCRKCGKRKSSSLPVGVGQDSFGPRLKSVISALSGFYKNSKAEIASIVKDIFNVEIAISSVVSSEARVAARCEEAYSTIELALSNSTILHIDETSHYNKGKLGR